MRTPETPDEPLMWEGVINDLLFRADFPHFKTTDSENVQLQMYDMCVLLVRERYAASFAEIQTYLRKREATLQIIAYPFSPAPEVACLDLRDDTSRTRWPHIVHGKEAIASQLTALNLSDVQNEELLTNETGILVSTINL